VEIQDYQETSVEEIINLWCNLNKRIIKVIVNIPNEKLVFLCDIGNNQLKTLELIIQDTRENLNLKGASYVTSSS